ncbi:MAG: alpha/beta fold hydrolase, partial [Myxococcota bacterium]
MPADETAIASDGVPLALRRFEGPDARAAVLVTHAMMATGQYLEKFAGHLAASGLDVFVLEFRGHGRSGGSARGFEDYVRKDLPAALDHVRTRSPAARRRLGYVGHSLGGLAGLAYAATHAAQVAAHGPHALVLVAVSLWRRNLAPLPQRWLRDATMAGFALTAALLGRVPARRLRLGAADEPRGYALQLARWHFTSTWRSPDGLDYARALANVRVPSLSVWSAGDPLARGRDVRAITDRLGV